MMITRYKTVVALLLFSLSLFHSKATNARRRWGNSDDDGGFVLAVIILLQRIQDRSKGKRTA